MKKLLMIILCLAMILPCFAGCNEQKSDVIGEDMTKYTIILATSAGNELKQQAQALSNLINEHTGVKVPVKTDAEVSPDSSSKEILLGQTNRSESAEVLKNAGTSGYAVKFTGNKLVITGTSDRANADGVQWFVQNGLIGKAANKGIQMDTSLEVSKSYNNVTIVENGTTNFSIVYSQHCDDNNGDPYAVESGYYNGGIDYEVKMARDIKDHIKKVTGVDVEMKTDAEPATGPEILVGKTNREAYNKFLANVGYVQYGFGYVDGSIVVAGYSTAANAMATKFFIDKLSAKNKNLSLELGEASLRNNSNWVSAFPSYDGGIVRGTSESAKNELQYYITNTSDAHFKAYCEKLEYYGYELIMSNDIPDLLLSRTYTNGKNNIHVYFAYNENTTRLYASSVSSTNYPTPDAGEYTKITDVQITQLQLDFSTNSGGMGYCITLEDGSFIMIDSGSSTRSGASVNYDHVRIWNLLNKLNKREDGQIIIRAWIITHAHSDHNGVYNEFAEVYGDRVTIESHYECVVSESIYYNSKNPGVSAGRPYTIHAGMKLSMYGVDLEFLFTPEDIYPRTLRYFNNASSVFTVSANGTKFMVLGDICDQSSDIISKRYGDYLKSDIVQVAHHGNIGATSELYDFIKPSVALWPTSQKLMEDLVNGEGNQRHFEVDYHLYKEMNIKEHYTNGEYTVTLTLGEDGYKSKTADKYVVSTKDQYKDKK
jgi:beta-lactamase superfamily II metal-dependent hydrolase